MRLYLDDANELWIQGIGMVHVAIAGPTRSSSDCRFCVCGIHFWPAKKAYILIVMYSYFIWCIWWITFWILSLILRLNKWFWNLWILLSILIASESECYAIPRMQGLQNFIAIPLRKTPCQANIDCYIVKCLLQI